MKEKGSVLIVDGNLFARKMFYKFKTLSSQVSLKDLQIISSNLAKLLSPKIPKRKKIKEQFVNKETGKTIKISKNKRIDGRVSKILEDENKEKTIITVHTGIAYGMIKSLLSIYKKYNIKYTVFAFDPVRKDGGERIKEYRSVLEEEYKANRESQDVNEFYFQLYVAQCILRLLGIEQVWTKEFEADDILHFYAKKVFKKENCLLLTSDHDLFQLLDERNSILKVGSKTPFFSVRDFEREFGISPKEYKDVLSLCGCSGDNVKGLVGISKNEALNLIRTFGTLKNLLKNFDKSENISTRSLNILKKEKKNRFKTILLTRKLISLYGLKDSFQSGLMMTKYESKNSFKDLLFVMRALKFRSLLGKEEKEIYKKIIKNQKGGKVHNGV